MNKNFTTTAFRKERILYFFFMVVFLFVCSSFMSAQDTRTVKGVITGEGETLIGAQVMEKNTGNATITDIEGAFTLNVKENATLVISYIGFNTKEVKVGNQSTLNIELYSDINVLDEVVAIGYGVQQKKLITGATVQVKGSDIAKLNTVNALGALQSQTPGVNITKSNGKPGEGFKVTIRGLGTIGNSNPLYIIDGVPNGDIAMLNPSDIESVDVLKDAASAAIYGARAANGVILITTKQGSKGKASVSYDGYVGWQTVAKKASLLNAQEYLMIMEEAGYDRSYFDANVPESILDAVDNGQFSGTNWLDEMILSNAPMQNHSLNITSGGDISVFSFGFSYTSQSPVIGLKDSEVNPKYERYTTRLNSEHNILKYNDRNVVQFGQTLTMGFTERSGLGMGTGSIYWNDIRNALSANPLLPVYDENGDYHMPLAGLDYASTNPLAEMDVFRTRVNSKNYSARGNFYLAINPVKDLKLRSTFGYAYNGWTSREYIPAYVLNTVDFSEQDRVTQGSGSGLQWSWDNTITYHFKINDHSFTALVGNSIEKWGLGEDLNGSNKGSEFDSFEFAYLSNVKTISSSTTLTGAPWGEGGIASFFGRINYDYKGKYMASAVMRADGSSNFARGKRWGYFPSISAGWNMAEEEFMLGTKEYIDQLKVRASWGENGNCQIPNFRYLGTIAIGSIYNSSIYYFGTNKENYTVGAYPSIIPNPDLTWETSRQFNIGVDTRFLANRLGFTFDWYNKKTIDWLVQPTVLGSWGTGAPYVNGGDVRNQGVELMLSWDDHIGDFSYGVRANMAYNKNKVLKIANGDGFINGVSNILAGNTSYLYRAEEGYPIGYFRGYKTGGIFQNQEEIDNYINQETGLPIMPDAKPGDVIFLDLNNDGTINEDDKTMIGNPHPDVTYGLTINLGYKGFDFSVTGYGVAGNQIAKSYRNFTDKPFDNYTTEILGRWHGEGTSNRLPAMNGSSINWNYISDLYIEDGDYFRITNLTVGYDFKRLFKSSIISQLRIYGTIQNLVTFTNYSGMDPEVGYNADQSWASGIDLGYYPSARTYMIGCNIKF
ncbi:MAG: TonB-dependent receptor [Candidatus Azobacteroides sp.]|nr:TonB-dependent receptor [Candidatus Azobacteroides sp.]